MDTDTLIITIDSLSYGGRGIGRREDGKVVFVPMVVPGETLRAHIIKEYSNHIVAFAEDIMDHSPSRVEPKCPVFSQCGGCDWQHITYSEQLLWKEKILLGEISKRCIAVSGKNINTVESAKLWGYRGHASIHCIYKPDFYMGFYKKLTNDIIGFEQCLILNQRIKGTLDRLRHILKSKTIHSLDSIDINAPEDEVLLLMRFKGSLENSDLKMLQMKYKDLNISGLVFEISGSFMKDYTLGQRFCRYSVKAHGTSMILLSGVGGFIQANMEVNNSLIEYVMDLAKGSINLLDLYSGNGNFSIPLSHVAENVVAVERNQGLVFLANKNAKKNHVKNIQCISMEAHKAVLSIKNKALAFDTIVLDPPREGAKDIVKILPHVGASRIIYISCNPSTLSRDLVHLISSGYKLKHIKIFDMFPQTFHIESVSFLER